MQNKFFICCSWFCCWRKEKIFRPIAVIDVFAQIKFALWTSEVIFHRMLDYSGVAMLMTPGADHKNAFLFPLLTFAYNNTKWEKIVYHAYCNNKEWSILNITIKHSQTERGLVFNSRLWILLSLLVSHPSRHYFSYFSAFLTYACMYG